MYSRYKGVRIFKMKSDAIGQFDMKALAVIVSEHGRSYQTCEIWQIKSWDEMSRCLFGLLHIPRVRMFPWAVEEYVAKTSISR